MSVWINQELVDDVKFTIREMYGKKSVYMHIVVLAHGNKTVIFR